ncbi:DUF4145 domain-containing protein [Pseudomonas nicosulfuronedens]|uniref:DUF4145 domain-containing protein n=1 Tax=Pseudomonas nicosulfuronedens TaxID=2571105 RepID=UPI00244C6D9C|nr:DUF4145 domain-containing protein [Pseudomonas nicosulfuronedens]MDH1007435.1 DUF4145 domain-containing protein [Pseudomonas nicosulfuronedens]MDH1977481.1 DUF4145 domain-containing protein [Pseudomonas nicosulfuronedens]MDH2028993.1 DUF4145 domain-containing protein [Pseudomonas nicosulfuronedens]
MSAPFTAPTFQSPRFNCPHCLAFAHVNWGRIHGQEGYTEFYEAICTSCGGTSIWKGEISGSTAQAILLGSHTGGTMIYPAVCLVPAASHDMPEAIAADFEEARQVFSSSPRAAAALLRLCVQKLCEHLLGKKGDINQQIAELVKNGLPMRIQQALDTIRVTGNNAVHPGVMNVEDRPELVAPLFGIVNFIVENQVTMHATVDNLFQGLPDGIKAAIEKRDAPKG